MRQQRKMDLINLFPAVPGEITEQMKEKKGAANFVVFLTRGGELFVRCFHRYSKGKMLAEKQRYVFAKDGAVRYGKKYNPANMQYIWNPLKEVREPVFCLQGYPGTFNNSYVCLNRNAIYKSDMRYCQLNNVPTVAFLEYLKLYSRHPTVEYLIKSGYRHLINDKYNGYWGNRITIDVYSGINWKSNNLLKMLHLNRTEFKLLQGRETLYKEYIWWRKEYPKGSPEQLITAAEQFGAAFGTTTNLMEKTGYSIFRISRYLTEQQVGLRMYQDYLEQCAKLKYDLHDTAICFPKNFMAMHERLTGIINAMKYIERKQQDKEKGKQIAKQIQMAKKYRKEMEFEYGGLILRQPYSSEEIINEGKALCHCVGGYVERHLKAQTNIFFIRHQDKPDIPYYTIEVSNDFNIRQCHGYKNDKDGKPDEIKEFEKVYTKYLEGLKNVRNHHQRAV